MRKVFGNLIKRSIVAAGVCAAVVGWAGCSAERDYKTLSFFFDGVPDPHAKAATRVSTDEIAEMSPEARKRLPVRSIHKPYADEQCTACHAQTAQVFAVAQDSNMCMTCHKPVLDEYPVMHGPIVGKACLWCHEPHESASPNLLKTTGAALCAQCHERELLSRKTPGHLSESGSCLDCHTGHGGHKAPFLRASAATPATKPAG